jgi:Omp85 superfamily domain
MPHLKSSADIAPSRFFATVLVFVTLILVNQSSAEAQSTPDCGAPSSSQTQTPPQSQHEKHVRVDAVDSPVPQSPVLPSAAETNSDTSGAGAQDHSSSDSRSELVFAPIPFSNQALTWGIIPVVQYIFPASKDDTTSPRSYLVGVGMAADGISWAIGGGGKFYLHKDRFRITTFGGHGTVAYDLFGIGNGGGNGGYSIPIRQGGNLGMGEFLVRIIGKVFVGPRYNYRDLSADLNISGGTVSLPAGLDPDDFGPQFITRGPGFKLLHDSRDSQFYPTRGNELQFYGDFFSATRTATAVLPEKNLDYQTYRFSENHYFSLTPEDVLAVRGMLCSTQGEAPFFELCQFGALGDIRGYEPGRYRDQRMYAAQAEYRRILSPRWGFTVFAGLGEVAPSWDSFNTKNLLPGGGAGIRFNLSKRERINLRADLAYGNNGWSWTFALGEAF